MRQRRCMMRRTVVEKFQVWVEISDTFIGEFLVPENLVSFSWADFGSFSTFFWFCSTQNIYFHCYASIDTYQLEHFKLIFLGSAKHVNEHWKFSFKLMLFQLNGRSFIVEFLWGSIGSQHQLHEHFERVENDYTRNMNSRMFLQQQTSNVTLKILLKHDG